MRLFIFLLFTPIVFGQQLNITDAEFFWGQIDPGFGNGTNISASDGTLDSMIEEVITNYTSNQIAYEKTLFNIRLKDAEGNWGPVFKKVVFIGKETINSQKINITGFEYFFGNFDPGNGNGLPILAFDGDLDSAIEDVFRDKTTWNVTESPVLFNIRAKDGDGVWGLVFKKVIFIGKETINSQKINITGFEYFFGNFDLGNGNGLPIVAFDGDLDSALEDVFRDKTTWNVTESPVLFNIRAKDGDGVWGPVFKKTVFPFGANTNIDLILEGDTLEICSGSSVTLTYSGPFGSIPKWFDNSTEKTITFIPENGVVYGCETKIGETTYNDEIKVVFKNQPTAAINLSGSILVCSTSNFKLEATSNNNYEYKWFLNGNIITNQSESSYLPTSTGSYTLEITDKVTGCSKISEPTILSTSFSISSKGSNDFCSEKEIMVTFGNSNSYQWKKNNINIEGATSNVYLVKESGLYQCIITNNNCSTLSNTLNLNSINPTKPVGESTQSFNANETLNNLIINGENIKWYDLPENGNILDSNTILENGKTYYASQTINGCESKERISVTVGLNTLSDNNYSIDGLVIQPNPTEDNIFINANEEFNKIEVYNTLGQKLEVLNFATSKSTKIDLTRYKSGLYFIYISNDKRYSVKSIIRK